MHFSSFTETDGGSVSLEIDFNASDMYEVFRSATGADGSVAEGRQIGSGNKLYQTHVGFQGWFFTEGSEALALEVEEALEGVYDILNSVSDESPVRGRKTWMGYQLFACKHLLRQSCSGSWPLMPTRRNRDSISGLGKRPYYLCV